MAMVEVWLKPCLKGIRNTPRGVAQDDPCSYGALDSEGGGGGGKLFRPRGTRPHFHERGHGGCSRPGPDPKGWGGRGSTDPRMVVRINGFCARWRRLRFCFKFFYFTRSVYTQNTQSFEEN